MDSTCATVCLDTPARIANRSSIKFANLKNTNGLVNFFWEPRGNKRGGSRRGQVQIMSSLFQKHCYCFNTVRILFQHCSIIVPNVPILVKL